MSYPTTEEFAPRVAEAGATPFIYRSTLPCTTSDAEWPTDIAAALALMLAEAAGLVPWQLATFEQDRPDLVVHDVVVPSARVLADRWNVPSLALSTTHVVPVRLQSDFDRLHAQDPDWIAYRARFQAFLGAHGISLPMDDFFAAPERCVVLIPRELQFRPNTLCGDYRFVGPSLRPGPARPSWQPPATDRKVLYISLGTAHSNRPDFYRACIDAFAGLAPWHLVLSVGDRVDTAGLRERSANAEVHRRVPQLEVLARADAFVTHAGMGSVLEALSCGVPMVAVAQGVDQPVTARQIEKLGLGRRLPPHLASADALRDAVLEVSAAPEVAARLKEMQRSIAASRGPVAAAELIEEAVRGLEGAPARCPAPTS